MATEIVTLGGFDDDEWLRAQNLRLPLLDYVGGIARMRDALDRALTVRKGIPVIGEKGVGKTVAVDCAVQAFQHREIEARRRDHKYQMRRVIVVPTLRSKRYREALLMIGLAVTGTLAPERAHGRRRSDDDLRHDLLDRCRMQRVVALIICEGEYLSKESRSLLRDLMGNSEDGDPSRLTEEGLGATGLGMLVVGTPAALQELRATEEFGQRWLPSVGIPGVEAKVAARVYRDWFPGIDAHARREGDAVWTAYIAKQMPRKPVALRKLDTHVRLYFRRMIRKARAESLPIPTRATVEFHDGLFLLTLREALSPEGGN
jgi:AAA domain